MWCGSMRFKVVVHNGVMRNDHVLGDMVATKLVGVIWSCGSSATKQDRDRLG